MARRNPQESSGPGWLPWAIAAGLVGLGSVVTVQALAPNLRELRLEPETRARYLELKRRLLARGVRLFTGSTRRTPEEEAKHLAEGRSATSISWHMSGRAVDAYPIDPATGKPDLKARRPDLFRLMHQEWARLGGHGLAYLPYPDGPNRIIKGPKGSFWDAGHLEFKGRFRTAAEAYKASQAIG